MPVVTYKCPACGSALSYDPQWEKFSCASCGSRYEEKELTHTVQDEPDALGSTMVYSCPSCGGEVVTEETTAAAFCYYCHNPRGFPPGSILIRSPACTIPIGCPG